MVLFFIKKNVKKKKKSLPTLPIFFLHVTLNTHNFLFGPSYQPCSCWTQTCPAIASEEANWSESALFDIKYVNLYQQPGSSNLID